MQLSFPFFSPQQRTLKSESLLHTLQDSKLSVLVRNLLNNGQEHSLKGTAIHLFYWKNTELLNMQRK